MSSEPICRYHLSRDQDIRKLVVATLLAYQELEGVLAPTAPCYDTHKFKPNRSSREILARYDAERSDFLRRVLACSKKARTWFSIDLTESAQKLGEPRQRLVAALEYLAQQGDLELEVSGVRHGYRVVRAPDDLEELVPSLYDRFVESERRDLSRLRGVLELAAQPGCLTRTLLDYFGEDLGEDCGHCDRCAGEAIPPMPEVPEMAFDEEDEAALSRLRDEGHAALAGSRQQARFLCGLPSPAVGRARLRKPPMFRRSREVPFDRVLELVSNAIE